MKKVKCWQKWTDPNTFSTKTKTFDILLTEEQYVAYQYRQLESTYQEWKRTIVENCDDRL
jgi:hypothetical protein